MSRKAFAAAVGAAWLGFSFGAIRGQSPTVATGAASGVTDIRASISGTVNANGGGTISPKIDFGLTTDYGLPAPSLSHVSGSGPVTISATFADLQPNTTYHYRLKVFDVHTLDYVLGADATFTTAPPTTPPGVLGNVSVYAVHASTAAADVIVAAGGASTTVSLEYGLTASYGSAKEMVRPISPGSTQYPSLTLTGLAPATTYMSVARP